MSAAGFIATSTSGASPGVKISLDEKWSWKPETPARLPAGARISAGKSGNVAMSLPAAAAALVNSVPVSCMPSPESPAEADDDVLDGVWVHGGLPAQVPDRILSPCIFLGLRGSARRHGIAEIMRGSAVNWHTSPRRAVPTWTVTVRRYRGTWAGLAAGKGGKSLAHRAGTGVYTALPRTLSSAG